MKKILILIIVMVFLVNSVNAIVCCEKLKGSANYCVDKINGVDITNINQCDTSNGFRAYQGTNCARLPNNNCKTGCCVDNNDGSCFNDKTKIICEKNNGIWSSNSCDNVDVCKEGCCFLNTNTFFSSNGECRIKAEQIGISPVFETGFSDDSECQARLNEILGVKDFGCCVSPDGNCQYVTREECNEDFRSGKYCMELNNNKLCRCEIGYKCVNDKKDVYKVSSCGDEKVQEPACNGIKEWCGLVRDSVEDSSSVYLSSDYSNWRVGLGKENIPGSTGDVKGIGCISINCEAGKKFIYDGASKLFYEDVNQVITITREMLGGSSSRRHGESWCMSPSEPDKPGTRHYFYTCDRGKIVPEPCEPSRYKAGVCKETVDNGFSEAKCVDSDWSNKEARDNPGSVKNPPAMQFYTGVNLDGVSLSDGCGYCNKKDKWYKPWDKCKSNMCKALGDCNFNSAEFSIGGCIKGALVAEALWLTAGSIAAVGQGEGFFTGTESFANTGWQGFWDTGPLGDWGKSLATKNAEKEIATKGAYAVNGDTASLVLKDGQFISDLNGGIYYKEGGSLYYTTDKAKIIGLIGEDFSKVKLGSVYSVPKQAIKKVAETVVIGEGLKTLDDIWKAKEPQTPQNEEKSEENNQQNKEKPKGDAIQNLENNYI